MQPPSALVWPRRLATYGFVRFPAAGFFAWVGGLMRVRFRILFLLGSIALIPSTTYAQGSIAGIVKDASGAVLPGVTVEASSPALIERTRSVVTDGTGQYKI